jgi:hypothetical protein
MGELLRHLLLLFDRGRREAFLDQRNDDLRVLTEVVDVEDSDEWCKDALKFRAWNWTKMDRLPFESLGNHGNESSFDDNPTSKLLCMAEVSFITALKPLVKSEAKWEETYRVESQR